MISLPVTVVCIVVPAITTPLALFIVCYLKNKPILSYNLMDDHFADLFLTQAGHNVFVAALSLGDFVLGDDGEGYWPTGVLAAVALGQRAFFLLKLLSLTASNLARRCYILHWQVGSE